MTEDELLSRYRKHMERRRKANDDSYGPSYVKDKVSRLKRLLSVVDVAELSELDESTFVGMTERLAKQFTVVKVDKKGNYYSQVNDYIVVLRYLYEMQTKKKAPRYVLYGGKLVEKYKK